MRFVSAERDGQRFAGVVEGDTVVPLAGIREVGHDTPLSTLRAASRDAGRAVALTDVVLRPVVPRPGKIICVGLNYHDHIAENERSDSEYPVLFAKFASALIGALDTIALPSEEAHPDYEGEIAVVIGKAGRRITKDDALDHIAGLTLANDVTMRDFQYKTHQWLQGKTWDCTTPLGPALVTLDEVDYRNLDIQLTLNGRTMQRANTSRMIFDIPTLVCTVSEFTTVEPGDIILTGTPGGVGYRREPRLSLREGDTVIVEADGLGRMINDVRAASAVARTGVEA